MLEACRAAAAIEWFVVAPATPGVVLPEYLQQEELIRVNLVAGRDTPEILLDEWGVRCNLTFRGRRTDCAIPWEAVLAGQLRPPERKRLRFGVIQGGKKD
jgi:stringent starvation protein B